MFLTVYNTTKQLWKRRSILSNFESIVQNGMKKHGIRNIRQLVTLRAQSEIKEMNVGVKVSFSLFASC